MGDIIIVGIPASLLLIALVQLAKKYILDRWIPLLSVVLGALLGLIASMFDYSTGYVVIENVIKGIVIGLASCGLWDVGKKSALNK